MRIFSILLILTLLSCTKNSYRETQRAKAVSSHDYRALNFPEFSPVRTRVFDPKVKMCPRTVTVAVIDTGVDYTHPALRDFLLRNPKELENGRDNDFNGFKEDVLGWDFVNDVNHPYDVHGHGTHISGIIAGLARRNNGSTFYQTPCTPNVKILPLKYYDNSGLGYNNLANTVRAFSYAVSKKVDIINYSSGGADPSPTEEDAIQKARAAGILVVTVAGNDGVSVDRAPYYPGSYALDNMITVASLNDNNELLLSSNFGNGVNVAAPGLGLLSTLPSDKLGTMSGTSQAAAYVSRLAVVLTSMDTTHSYKRVRDVILKTAIPIVHPFRTVGYGRVNPEAAFREIVRTGKVKVR